VLYFTKKLKRFLALWTSYTTQAIKLTSLFTTMCFNNMTFPAQEEPATTDIDLNTATEENTDLWVSFRVRAFKRLPTWEDKAEDEITRMLYASHKMELICKFHDCDSVGYKPTGNRSHIYYIIKNDRAVMCYVLDLRLQTLAPNIPQFQDATRHLN